MSGKFALIIRNTEYTDAGLSQLTAPGKDAEAFVRVLKAPDICAFDDVSVLLNQPSYIVGEAIDTFFYQKKPDDLLIVYFSGHGVRDEFGALYLAVKNTNRTRLRATAIRSDYLREAMDQSRSKRQVVILDCCNSGAFPQGTKAETGGMMGMVNALQGYGRFVLTASDATQFAWEGDKLIGETQNSLFTHFIVKGLEGEADRNGDGRITVDELYDYAFDEISKLTPKQTPAKSISKQEGEIVLRQITRMEDIKPIPLPDDLLTEIDDLRPYVREAAEKAEREDLGLAARRKAEKKEQAVGRKAGTTRPSWLRFGVLGGVIIGIALCGFAATRLFPVLFGGTPTTEAPTQADIPAATEHPNDTPESPGAVTAECNDALGCVTVGPSEPIHLAYALVVTGQDETLGIDSRTGIEVAMALKGQVLGHDVQLTGEDDGCSAEGGQTAGTKLSTDPSIVAVIGTSCSSSARAAVPLLSQAGFVIISPSNTAPDLTRLGDSDQHAGYLRTAYNDEVQGAAAARFAFEALGVRKAATIHDGSLYAESLQAQFAQTFKELGGEITTQEAVNPNGIDFKSALTSVAASDPEFVYLPIFVNTGSLIINQATQVPGLENVYLMGADAMFSADIPEIAGAAVEGVFISSPDVSAFSSDYESVFLPKYRELAGSDPVSIFHAYAFDATNMLFAAIEKTAFQDADGTLHIPRQALRDVMYATKDFKGLTGNLTCSPTGDCADPKIAVYKYHAGQYPPERIWP